MYARILVPLDGSPIAEQALPYAELFARTLGARLDLLTAVPSIRDQLENIGKGTRYWGGWIAGPLDEAQCRAAQERLTQEAFSYLERVGEATRVEGVRLRKIVAIGIPRAVILAEAVKRRDTLIALTTHGRSGVGRWLLGSVADVMVREASRPVLLVRARHKSTPLSESSPRFRGVVTPLDGSDLAEQALDAGVSLAEAMRLPLLLLRAVTPLGFGHVQTPGVHLYSDIWNATKAEGNAYLEAVAARIKSLRKYGFYYMIPGPLGIGTLQLASSPCESMAPYPPRWSRATLPQPSWKKPRATPGIPW